MADDAVPVQNSQAFESELEKSRESAARLMENLARKIGRSRAMRTTAQRMERAAHFVQEHRVKEMAAGIDRAVRRHPATAIMIAVAAGLLVGRALRSR